jgi:putative glutathione S-transferase
MSTVYSTDLSRETGPDGAFVRQRSAFRDWVSADGSTGYRTEPGRYHLYVSLACPWAHRTVIVRALKGLEDVISLSVVNPLRDERGWRFGSGREKGDGEPDPVNGLEFLSEAYVATDPAFDGRVTTPTLFDRERGRVVNNESADVVRMLNTEWNEWGNASVDLYPADLRGEIDEINELVYETVNNGVYRSGFARSQAAYEEAVHPLFETLDQLEERLDSRRYLAGSRITEADWRLFTTLVRFDPVYHYHFKCNLRRLEDYPNLSAYTRELYQVPGVAETVDFDHIKRHYYMTHDGVNPTGIVPVGPPVDFSQPHDRDRLPADTA